MRSRAILSPRLKPGHGLMGFPTFPRQSSGTEIMLDGRAPRHGEMMRLPQLAGTLKTIAEGGPRAFYEGELGG